MVAVVNETEAWNFGFFFQAEDGIRDVAVTGVQTCALPISLHDIDIAHAGAYSLYIEGIRRTDRLSAEIWKAIQSEPEYAGKCALFILPDFGRDSDEDAGGNGFQHHRTGDVISRTTWMMALGPGIREGVV